MHSKTITILLTLLTTLLISSTPLPSLAQTIQTTGNATITNKTPDPIYLWSVGTFVSPQHTLTTNETYTEPFHHDPVSGGIAIKITKVENGLYDGSPQLTYAYTLDESTHTVWYDLSDVYGHPFSGGEVLLAPDDERCGGIRWPYGIPVKGGGNGGGNGNSSSSVRRCFADGDVGLSIGA